MLNLRNIRRVVIVGGGTAGWFAALSLRRVFAPNVEVRVIESPDIGIVGVGEGGLINLIDALNRNNIAVSDFMRETGAAFKLGFCYEGWRGGGEQDKFYHLFADPKVEELAWSEYGGYPLITALIHQNYGLDKGVLGYNRGYEAITGNVSQAQMTELLVKGESGLTMSLHFDSYRVAEFLKQVAISRGVVHQQGKVETVTRDDLGLVKSLQVADVDGSKQSIDLELMIDASGFARLGVGKTEGAKWRSFKDYLLMDSAIPFHMPHPNKHPALVTRAIAMGAGWMWQIPLIERVGAGYVFSSAHMDPDRAVQEIEAKVGHAIEPIRTLRFEPGHFEQVWMGNVLALGLASGFVEPLEATSIGQMLEQLKNFERVLVEGQGVILDTVIDGFNAANAQCWSEIRDFLRMHYDCPRRDNEFWRAVAGSKLPATYQDFKASFALRTPRSIDVQGNSLHGWGAIFHVMNWLFVAQPLGLLSREAAQADLMALSEEKRRLLDAYMNKVRQAKPSEVS